HEQRVKVEIAVISSAALSLDFRLVRRRGRGGSNGRLDEPSGPRVDVSSILRRLCECLPSPFSFLRRNAELGHLAFHGRRGRKCIPLILVVHRLIERNAKEGFGPGSRSLDLVKSVST